jgi:hypothetical protein
MNLKSILNSVLGESGFLEKSAFAASSDVDDKQMVAIANRMAYKIFNFYNWSAMRQTWVLEMTTTGAKGNIPKTVYNLPTDWQTMVPDSVWETDGSRRVELPVPENRWFLYKHTVFSDGGTMRARLYGNTIEIHDASPGESITLEYITNTPIRSAAGDPKQYFTADDDIFILDPETLITGVQWKWGHAKMMPQVAEWRQDHLTAVNGAIGRDAGGRTVGGQSANSDWMRNRGPYYPLYQV